MNEEQAQDQQASAQGDTGESTAAPEVTEPTIKYYYHPKRNTRNESFAGVPLADLTEEQVNSYPRWIQAALAGAKYYQAEPPDEEE